ncbi:MAG: hypothetical protein AAF206_25295 [Bacteroidota bacterium]
MKNGFFFSLIVMVLLTLLIFGILHWTSLPMDYFMDWLIGVGLFWWLVLITTVPWNLHFKAREVLSDAQDSVEAGIGVNETDIRYAQKISRTYLWVAIALHLFSAIGLYFLAKTQIGAVGYVGSVFALLLTGLRPAVRLYDYLSYRLSAMKERIKYPREDILKLKKGVGNLIKEGKAFKESTEGQLQQQEEQLEHVRASLRSIQQEFDRLTRESESQHASLVKATEDKISLLSEDAQFLNQVRALLRFVKEA